MPMRTPARRGSIYVLTLFTVAAVGSMVLIGVAVRSSTSSKSVLIEQMNENRSGVLNAAELAIAKINADLSWRTNAQKGYVFSDLTLGDHTFTSSVIDGDTLSTPSDTTTNYRVTVTSTTGIASDAASLDINYTVLDYQEYLEKLGLDAYWALDEAQSSTRADEPIDGRDGGYQEPDHAGTEINNEGGLVPVFSNSNDYVETPYNSHYQDDTEGTVSFWMKLTGTNNVATYGIFGQRFTYNGMPAVSMTCTANSLSAYMDDGGSFDVGHFSQTPAKSVAVGEWHHVAMTWGGNGLCVYIDGVLLAQNKTCTEYWDTQSSFFGMQPMIIGASYIPAASNQPRVGFEGSIARFAIISSQLDDATIAELAAVEPDLRTVTLIEQSWAQVYE